MNKFSWVVSRPENQTRAEFGMHLRAGQAEMMSALPSAQEIAVTIQEDGAFSNAQIGGRPVDALIEITTTETDPETDPIVQYVSGISSRAQGWRVHPTVIYDVRNPIEVGEQRPGASLVIFIRRLDGTSPEHFNQNWYHHAGYPSERRQLEPFSQAKRERLPEDGPIDLYRQNRLLEALTPTDWVVHGYTQLNPEGFATHIPEGPYERWRHEEPFDRVETHIVQGREFRVL